MPGQIANMAVPGLIWFECGKGFHTGSARF